MTGSGPEVATEKAKYSSLTVAVGPAAGAEESVEAARDGTYRQGLVVVNRQGTETGSADAASYTITMSGGRRTGRFTLDRPGGATGERLLVLRPGRIAAAYGRRPLTSPTCWVGAQLSGVGRRARSGGG